jgi:hypothetical protein
MIVQLTPTVITFNAAGGAARNPATRAPMPINLAELERHPFSGRRPTLSLCAMRDRQCHWRPERLHEEITADYNDMIDASGGWPVVSGERFVRTIPIVPTTPRLR